MVQTRGHTEGAVFAVYAGRACGIFTTWREALKQVKDFEGAVYKKHDTRAAAEAWLEEYPTRQSKDSARTTARASPAEGGPFLNALALDINAPTFSQGPSNAAEPTATAPAPDETMDVDDGIPSVREVEELLRKAQAKEAAKAKARLGAAAEAEFDDAMRRDASASVKREDARVKREDARVKREEIVEVDVKTWSSVKIEPGAAMGEGRYTSSEKGKWRAGSSRAPVAGTSSAAPGASKPVQTASGSTAVKTEARPSPISRSTPSVAPTPNQRPAAPPRQPQASPAGSKTTISSASTSVKAPAAATAAVASLPSPPASQQTVHALPGPVIIAYTDGAAPDNQSKDLRVAGYGIHWAAGRPAGVIGDISCRCANGRTNNYAELLAIIRTLEFTTSDPRPLTIVSDSDYSIKSFTWIDGWRRRGWKTSKNEDVKNLEMIRYMVALRALRAGPTTFRHVKAHKADKSGASMTPDQRGNKLADALAVAGAKLPESAAEKNTDEDWAKARASAEQRLEERKRKQDNETVHIDVGSALGLSQAPAPDVAAAAQAVSRMTIADKKQESATKADANAKEWKKEKLSSAAILAALHSPPQADKSGSSSNTAATQTLAASQSKTTLTPPHTSSASASAPSTVARAATSQMAPQTPHRSVARTEHTPAQTARAHTTPVAAGPAKQGGKAIVRVIDPDEDGYDEGIWEEEDTLDDAAMIAEALGH